MAPVVIATSVLEEARTFFEDRGSHGLVGTAMIVATGRGPAERLVIPTQRAGRPPRSWVEVTRKGQLQLAAALGPEDQYVARIHSHPLQAFHSNTDDANPALTHQGAISVVVPYFGLGLRHGLDACAVFVRQGPDWRELAPGPARDAVVRTTAT
jgi:hypothetical protein